MFTVCWAAKGGSGTTVVAASLALAADGPTLLVDLAGDLPMTLGVAEPDSPGVHDWLRSEASADRLTSLESKLSDRLSLLPAGTGTGATGWLRSAWKERSSPLVLPAPEDPGLCFFVREAWPSPATGTALTEGFVPAGSALTLHAESDELVSFGDGIEEDALQLSWGQTLTIAPADRTLNLVVG